MYGLLEEANKNNFILKIYLVYISINLLHEVNFLSGVLNSDFSFSLTGCRTKIKTHCLPYYLLIAEKRIVEYMPFPRVLALYENINSLV